jgi:hypothetical protein
MVLPTLPWDVLASIVNAGSFNKQELSMISLASSHLRYEAQRRLFRDPGPHTINVLCDADSSNTARMFLEALASSPNRLALMVRRYCVTISWFDFHARFEPEKRYIECTLFDHLSNGLQLMVNLKELRYHERLQPATDPVSCPPPPIWPVFKRCSFRLQVFCCSYVGTKNRDALAAFLHSQSGIREIWLREELKSKAAKAFSTLQDIFKDACPSLVSLGGMTEIVASMLAGRQALQHMCWEEKDYPTTVKYTRDLFRSANTSGVELMESLQFGPPLSLLCEIFENIVVLKTCERDVIQV